MNDFSFLKACVAITATIVAVSSPAQGQGCDPPPAGLVSWWQAESNAYDSVQLAPGAPVGGVAYVPGKVGTAFSFDGMDGTGVNVGNPSYLQLETFTIEGWVRRQSATQVSLGRVPDGVFLCYGWGGYAFGMHSDGTLELSQVGISVVYSAATITDTNYHHVAVTFSGSSAVFYIDGNPGPAKSYSASFYFNTACAIGSASTVNGAFLGDIDELSLYSRPLNASEIQAIFSAGSSGKCLAPVIANQPANVTAGNGQQAVFTVTALGSEPLSYQWQSNGFAISKATNASLVVPGNGANENNAVFTVLVSNGLGTVESAPATLTVGTFSCAPPPPGIVSWWRAEGNAEDSIQLTAGTLAGGTRYVPGKVGMAFSFDGVDGTGVNLGNPSYLQLETFTIEGWVRRQSATRVSLGPVPDGVFLCYGWGGYAFGMHSDGTLEISQVGISVVYSSTAITDTNYHHVAVTFSGGSAVFYIDGNPGPAKSYSASFYFNTACAIGSASTVNGAFLGDIDELSLYSRPLNASEIQAIFNAGTNGKCLLAPTITSQPASEVAVQGSNAVLSVGVTSVGLIPTFQWFFDGQSVPGATGSSLVLTNLQAGQAGTYDVVVSSSSGTLTSSNAVLTIIPDNPLVSVNGQISLTNNSTNAALVEMSTTFINGTIFYTLDGSEPDFTASLYDGPFDITQSAIVRAIAYDTNLNTVESLPVYLTLWYTLTVANAGGGNVSVNPPNGVYPSGQMVQVTATPINGWQFLQWSGDASGTNSTITFPIEESETIAPIFGTTIKVNPVTNGTVQLYPAQTVFAYGSTVELSAVPNAGYQFGLWGGAASGAMTPYILQVVSPTPTILARFGALPPGDFSLTVIPNGSGTISPYENHYPSNSVVSLTATGAGTNRFYFWSGNASGTNDPLSVLMRTNTIIVANFVNSNYPAILSAVSAADGAASYSVVGTKGQLYDIQVSSNLVNWSLLKTVSNPSGALQFVDPTTNSTMQFYRVQSH